MRKIIIFLVLLAVSIGGYFEYRNITSLGQDGIRISSNPWVGFTPFIYAQEKGWLEKTPFHFVWQVDLTENSRLYDRGLTQGFTATQYELLHFKDRSHIKPVFLIDRSAGADAILSNWSLASLRNTVEPVTVYLELGSLHDDLFKAFVRENGLENLKFVLTNSSQKSMVMIQPAKAPIIVLSYAPYATELIRNGFSTIASTQTMKSFFVIDALYVDERYIDRREQQYQALKDIFDRALARFHTNPKEYYETIHGYLEGQSYEEFMASTTQIAWLTHSKNAAILQQLQSQHISTERLLP
jgi:NitT/TauT family transport system substrate-binding protein